MCTKIQVENRHTNELCDVLKNQKGEQSQRTMPPETELKITTMPPGSLKPQNMEASSAGAKFKLDLTTTIIYIWATEGGETSRRLRNTLQ